MGVYLLVGLLILTAMFVVGAHYYVLWLIKDNEEPDQKSASAVGSAFDARGNAVWRAFVRWRRGKPPMLAHKRNTSR